MERYREAHIVSGPTEHHTDPVNRAEALQFAVADPGFFVAHRPETRTRPMVASRLLPKISAGVELTSDEFLLALGEARCFERMHVRAVDPTTMENAHNQPKLCQYCR